MKYRKKPVEVEAFQIPFNRSLLGTSSPEWWHQALIRGDAYFQGGGDDWYFTVKTLEGELCAAPGDWIIKGVKGEIYPCKPEIFAMTYEELGR